VASHEHNLLPFSKPQSHALLSAESKATEAANNKERLGVCHDILCYRTLFNRTTSMFMTSYILQLQVEVEVEVEVEDRSLEIMGPSNKASSLNSLICMTVIFIAIDPVEPESVFTAPAFTCEYGTFTIWLPKWRRPRVFKC
jgi:hypothetical protein